MEKIIKTEIYGEVKVYDYEDKASNLRRTIIEGEPFGKLDFDDTYPSAEQMTAEDVDWLVDSMKV